MKTAGGAAAAAAALDERMTTGARDHSDLGVLGEALPLGLLVRRRLAVRGAEVAELAAVVREGTRDGLVVVAAVERPTKHRSEAVEAVVSLNISFIYFPPEMSHHSRTQSRAFSLHLSGRTYRVALIQRPLGAIAHTFRE